MVALATVTILPIANWSAQTAARQPKRWCAGTLVRWCAGTLVRWYAGALVRWYAGALVRWCGLAAPIALAGLVYNVCHTGLLDFLLQQVLLT